MLNLSGKEWLKLAADVAIILAGGCAIKNAQNDATSTLMKQKQEEPKRIEVTKVTVERKPNC